MITAEEFIQNFLMKNHKGNVGNNTEFLMIEFAKLHVKAALEAALNNVQYADGNDSAVDDIDEESIIKSYPLESIK